MAKLVGLYSGARTVVDHADYLRALQQEIGLTHLIMGGLPRLSAAARALSPERPDFQPPGKDDHEDLKQAVGAAHRMGLQVWFCHGGWHGIGSRNPERCMLDMRGRPLLEVPVMRFAREQNCVSCCPSDEQANAWLTAYLSEAVAAYEVDGVDLTHFRYTAPGFAHNLFGCACPRCARLAGERGYDFEAMRQSALAFWDRLSRLEAAEVRAAAEQGLGLLDLSQWLGIDGKLVEWFEFRSGVLTGNLERLSAAARQAAGRPLVFGGDTFPPTFSALVGHSYRGLSAWADYTSPLLSHVTVFVLSTLSSWAALLCQWIEGLNEADALRLVRRLFGYDHLPLPDRLEAYDPSNEMACEMGCGALQEIVELEMCRARRFRPAGMPCYPVIKGAHWPAATVRALMAAAAAMGHEGIILQGTSSIVAHPGLG